MPGTEGLCQSCEDRARVAKSVDRMLVKRLKRAEMFDKSPRLHGDPPSVAELDNMTEADAFSRVCIMRWPVSGDPVCPKCGHGECYTIRSRWRFKCKRPDCYHQFTPVAGTVFERFKGGYIGLLRRMAYDGPTHKAQHSTAKTAADVRRRMSANGQNT